MKHWTNGVESNVCRNPSSKKFFNYVNKKLNSKPIIPPLFDESKNCYAVSDDEKASLFNSYFQSVFITDDGIVPDIPTRSFEPMKDFTIPSSDILAAIRNMKDKISRSPENIPLFFIKRIAPVIIKPLTDLFNVSLKCGLVPHQWKTAIIVPVHKNNDKSKPSNHRPVSLSSSFSRIFESIIKINTLTHLDNNKLISPHQFGFLPNKSSCSQLLSCIHEWFLCISKSSSINLVYTDISKAFDSVSHQKLVKILESYGISKSVTVWIKEFLTDRQQKVSIGSSMSPSLPISSGVPQGSVIGPLLFLLYFNDITSTTTSDYGASGIKLFADDAKLYSADPVNLQRSLNDMFLWLNRHQLTLAKHKCFSMQISRPACTSPPSSFHIDGTPILTASLSKDLGIQIAKNLKWSQHVDYIYKTASSQSYRILKCFKSTNIWILVKLFVTYVRPKLEYNTPVWSPYLNHDIDKIESVQRNFTRKACIRCGIKFSSYTHRLYMLNLISLQKRRIINDLLLLYKIVYNISDLNFSDYFIFHTTKYNLRSNTMQIKLAPNIDLSLLQWKNSFFVRAISYWNKLPDEAVRAPSISIFKNCILKFNLDSFVKKNTFQLIHTSF